MNRCSFCEWIPILPWPVWPLAGHARLGQNTVAGSMTILLSWLCWGACQEKVCLDPRFLCNLTLPRLSVELPVEDVDYVTGDTDFSAHITKIKAKTPDMIAVGGTWVEAANMIKEAEKQDLKVLWVGGVGFGNARIIENTGEASEGAIHNATYDADATTEMNQSYVRRLLEKVPNETPHWPAANCYDAMKILALAIKQANITNTPKTRSEERRV